MLRKSVLYIVLWVSLAVQAAVYTPASVPNPKEQGQGCYVANPDALLADSDVVFLNTCAQRLEAATNVELCVVALASIGEQDAFDFSYTLFQRWGIGRKGQNTGVLVFFAKQSHDIRIMTGVGIEGVLTDARCAQIIREEMTPAFRRGDYGGGLCLGALRIYEVCTNGEVPEELRAMRSVTDRGGLEPEEDEMVIWITIIVTLILLIVIVWLSNKYGKGGKGGKGGRSGGYDDGGPVIMPRGGFGGGYSGGFSGGSWGGGSTMGGGAGGKW